MKATAADADQAFRFDHLFDTGKMLWKRAAIDCAWLGNPVSSTSVGLILGMDRGHGRFQVFQCQIELVGIGLLGLAPEGRSTGSGPSGARHADDDDNGPGSRVSVR
ncbi:hypothetical protein ATY81_25300 [Rhizobium sp. R72]|nr:hypothetical protein ATY81_25300 [Rhizobium sp. R72]OWW00505.1 hypothetical protein ATY80_25300 [Rhizobium sp. R711]